MWKINFMLLEGCIDNPTWIKDSQHNCGLFSQKHGMGGTSDHFETVFHVTDADDVAAADADDENDDLKK